MTDQPVRARLLRQIESGGVVFTELSLRGNVGEPFAPAFLFRLSAPGELVQRKSLQILEWFRGVGAHPVFESRGHSTGNLIASNEYGFQQIYSPSAWDAVRDLGAAWELRDFPADEDHDHCAITWEKISPRGPERRGYWNSRHGWISVDAYERDIAGDEYGIRARIAAGRIPGRELEPIEP